MDDMPHNEHTITLTDNVTGESIKLPIIKGTIGPDVIDVRTLYGLANKFTFDPGYGVTGSCISELTYIDGDEGILLHRGYAIEELAEKSDFLEVAYLLLNGELPKIGEKEEFVNASSLRFQ